MYNTKLPLFQKGDILRHIEHNFEREVVTVFENEDHTFSYNCTVNKVMPLLFSEDELFNEYNLL
jgi:hypothetical protein